MDNGEGARDNQSGENWNMTPPEEQPAEETTPEEPTDNQAEEYDDDEEEEVAPEEPKFKRYWSEEDLPTDPEAEANGFVKMKMYDGSWDYVPLPPADEDPVDFYLSEGIPVAGLPGLPDPR